MQGGMVEWNGVSGKGGGGVLVQGGEVKSTCGEKLFV